MLVLTIYILTFCVGFPANAFAFITLLRKARRRVSSSDVLLLNLTAADLLLLLFLPFKMAEIAAGMTWPLPVVLCPVANFCFYSSIYLSSLFLAALSVERYLGVVFPIRRYQDRRRPGRAMAASVILWLVACSHCSIVFVAQYHDGRYWGATNGSTGNGFNPGGFKMSSFEGSKMFNLEGSKMSNLNASKTSNLNGPKMSNLGGSKTFNLNGPKMSNLGGSKTFNLNGPKMSNLGVSKTFSLNASKLFNLNGPKMSNLNGLKMSNLGGSKTFNLNDPKMSNLNGPKMSNLNGPKMSDLDGLEPDGFSTSNLESSIFDGSTPSSSETSSPNTVHAEVFNLQDAVANGFISKTRISNPNISILSPTNVSQTSGPSPPGGHDLPEATDVYKCYDDFSKDQLSVVLPFRLELFLVLFLLPFAVTVFCYVNFVRVLLSRPNIPLEKKQRAVGLAVATMVNFGVCFAPYNLSHVVGFAEKKSPDWRVYALLLTSLNATLDPVIFYFSSRAVQKAVAAVAVAAGDKLRGAAGRCCGAWSPEATKGGAEGPENVLQQL